jgi:hypothetical protein
MIILPSRVKLPGLNVRAAQVSVSLVMIGVDRPGFDRGLGVVHNPCFRIHLDKSGKDLELTRTFDTSMCTALNPRVVCSGSI